MSNTEEYFPRGGKKPTAAVYKPSSNFLGTYEKVEKKKKRSRRKAEGDDGYLSDEIGNDYDKSISNCAIGLSYQTIKEGVLVLGRIRHVIDTKIEVSLPCAMHGNVMACHISESYNKLLEEYVNDKVESVSELSKMFRIGQYVATKVLEVEGKKLMLSMMPQHVNSGRLHSELHKGTLLQAAVSSVEDHGYVMDLGIPNTRAFLPKKEANEEVNMDVGSVLWCTVKAVTPSTDNSVVTLTSQPAAAQAAVARKPAKALLPGTAVEFTVDKALENGIEGHIFDGVTCYIQRAHADSGKGKKPGLGQRVRARILYELPTRKTPFLTMRNIFEATYPDLGQEQAFKVGDVIEEAKVLKVTKRSIVFKLGHQCTGLMSVRRARLDDELADEQALAKLYPPGSEHKVRVLNYNLSDYNYSVSDEASVLQQRYFALEQLTPGMAVDAEVVLVADAGLTLQVGRVRGFVPRSHVTDSGVYIDPKKGATNKPIKKKYKVGQQVEARVLATDAARETATLTMKPTLLDPQLEVLASYSDAVVGKVYTGVIKLIKEFVVVSFFGGVTAYVPKMYVAEEPLEHIGDAFHLGQIVNCTILKVDPEEKKMIASFLKKPLRKASKDSKAQKRKNEDKTVENDQSPPKKNKESTTKQDNLKDKKSKNNKKKEEAIESSPDDATSEEETESDAIESDIQDTQVLSPADMQLLDLSDCSLRKHWRKRIAALSHAINCGLSSITAVDEKLDRLREKGVDKKNKQLTSLETKKATTEQRVKALAKAFKTAQHKFAEMPKEKDYKTTKEIRQEQKELRKEQRDKEKKEKEVKVEERVSEIKIADAAPALEVPSVKDFFTASLQAEAPQREESSSSEDEEVEAPKKKRKKLTAAEKVAKAREEEASLRRAEAAAAAGGRPRSVEQFERALLAKPDSAELWLAYAALHLQSTEIEKARSVCRRALNTIGFREEDEKLNVWLAMLNIEHRFGTKETQQKTLEEALQMNDTFKVHSKLLDIFVDTSKGPELLSLVELMMKKYRRDPNTYILCGTAAYKAGMVDKARQVMQKAVGALEKKEHVAVLVQFALLERDSGSRERAEALFEQILGVFPQRVDVAAAYADMLHKAADPDAVRQVMERMTSQKLPARKMKVLYKKWIELEERSGDQSQVDRVRQRAAQFIESAKF